jgi:hypothetical protein
LEKNKRFCYAYLAIIGAVLTGGRSAKALDYYEVCPMQRLLFALAASRRHGLRHLQLKQYDSVFTINKSIENFMQMW